MTRKRSDLTVIPPGARVGLRIPGIREAEVLTVQIRAGGYLTYEVAWWVDGERFSAWVEAFEIDDSPAPIHVGFATRTE